MPVPIVIEQAEPGGVSKEELLRQLNRDSLAD